MKKTKKLRDSWGEYVIYVQECDKYEYEKQNLHNAEERKNV